MTVKIVFPKGEGLKAVWGTKVFTESGEEIENITRIEMDVDAESILQAKITVAVSDIENLEAHPILSEASMADAAKLYGYELVKK